MTIILLFTRYLSPFFSVFLTINSKTRTYTVKAKDRTYIFPAKSRTYTIGTKTRSFTF